MRQMTRKAWTRVTAMVAALCMVLALMPAMAFAAPATTGSINFLSTSATTLTVASGQTATIGSLLGDPTVDGDWHYDYVVASGTGVTVNKHTGVVTAATVAADTTVTVTVYLMADNAPTGNSGKPCTGYTVLDQETVTVNVTATNTYGYQGNAMTLKMTSPAVTSYSGSNTSGWTNQLASSAPIDGYYYFTVMLSNGFSNYNTAALFATRNAGNVTISDSAGLTPYSLATDNTGNVTVDSVDVTTKTVTIKVSSDVVTTGDTRLTFSSAFRGNNNANTLGTTITFVIN